MANKIREKIGKKIGAVEKRLEKTFEKTLELTFQTAMNSPITAKAANAAEKVQARVEKARATAKGVKSTAQATAKQSLDQVLLGLQHKGVGVKDSKDLVYAVGKKVLERAEAIREQVAANPMAPTWIKDLKLNNLMPSANGSSGAEATEFGADYASATAGTTQAAPKAKKAGATEGDATLAAEAAKAGGAGEADALKAAAAAGDGEAEEALEDSVQEKASGAIAEGDSVIHAAPAKASSSRKASNAGNPIEEAVEKTKTGVAQASKAKAKKSKSTQETAH